MNGHTRDIFTNFFKSEKAAGFILIACAIFSLVIANIGASGGYIDFWHSTLDLSFFNLDLKYTVEQWVNDGLMTIFFLLVGLEIERELYVGELSTFKNAILPILAAIGGMLFPALIHLALNFGTDTQSGFGIPMATDIAFALGILSLAGKSIPVSLKVFLTALAIIDDLGAITVIAIFYSKGIVFTYLLTALGIFLVLFILGRMKIYHLLIYILGGIVMWYCMLKSGVHPSIAGVLLAFAIPTHKNNEKDPSFRLQHFLHYPVAFLILPVFALANTAIIFPDNLTKSITTNNSAGIIAGLLIGKFAGIFLVVLLAVKTGLAKLPSLVNWRHIFGVSLLGGIGFTMSMFISNLAFTDAQVVISSKMSILVASFLAAAIGLLILVRKGKAPKETLMGGSLSSGD
jgi:NhaA family Na+:H+ antiporter